MRRLILTSIMLSLAACGSGAQDDSNSATTQPSADAASSSSTPAMPEVVNKLPFDMPIMPGARYISGSPKFSRPTKKRGARQSQPSRCGVRLLILSPTMKKRSPPTASFQKPGSTMMSQPQH